MIRFFLYLIRLLEPELSHKVSLNLLKVLYSIGLARLLTGPFKHFDQHKPFKFKNLLFKNRLGIAAGLDKNGDFIDPLGALGVGFVEVGTVTPKPQLGNQKPRVFRDSKNLAIINKLGFNNKGVDYLVQKLKKRKFEGIVGVNIGANADSKKEERIDDYLYCFKKVANYSDYITINISSPNTTNLRDLQSEDNIGKLLSKLDDARKHHQFVGPIFVKISPDEDADTLKNLLQETRKYNLDGIIATNTTINRDNLKSKIINQKGGLSGKPLRDPSMATLRMVHKLDSDLTLISVGGVLDKGDYNERINAGASLVQIYTGFIFKGPKLIKDILDQ